MGISGAKEVKFTTFAGKKFNRAQTHRWRSDKYYCWDAIFVSGVNVPITANKHKKQIICLEILPIMWYTIL